LIDRKAICKKNDIFQRIYCLNVQSIEISFLCMAKLSTMKKWTDTRNNKLAPRE
jgi:hypothetical protein